MEKKALFFGLIFCITGFIIDILLSNFIQGLMKAAIIGIIMGTVDTIP